MDRNLNPELVTKEVIMARILYNNEYAHQGGGQVDFWEKLSPSQKKIVERCVDQIEMCKRRQGA